jgi:hypothetical protein
MKNKKFLHGIDYYILIKFINFCKQIKNINHIYYKNYFKLYLLLVNF